mmetsp:Transcript_37538/g.77023  ORF Transcript_37538/g.77023 Transcript_37538/m.77023 type:complete len:204 (-) Transcript_37538:387-998(-)
MSVRGSGTCHEWISGCWRGCSRLSLCPSALVGSTSSTRHLSSPGILEMLYGRRVDENLWRSRSSLYSRNPTPVGSLSIPEATPSLPTTRPPVRLWQLVSARPTLSTPAEARDFISSSQVLIGTDGIAPVSLLNKRALESPRHEAKTVTSVGDCPCTQQATAVLPECANGMSVGINCWERVKAASMPATTFGGVPWVSWASSVM